MSQSTVNVRIDDDLKQSFDDVCNELGLSMSSAITVFVRKVCREHRIPFDVSLDPFYSESNMLFLSDSIRELESGKVVNKTLEELRLYENE